MKPLVMRVDRRRWVALVEIVRPSEIPDETTCPAKISVVLNVHLIAQWIVLALRREISVVVVALLITQSIQIASLS